MLQCPLLRLLLGKLLIPVVGLTLKYTIDKNINFLIFWNSQNLHNKAKIYLLTKLDFFIHVYTVKNRRNYLYKENILHPQLPEI